jgi:hypothetical protein
VIYALSIHADYRCRNSGNCCSVDWDVPVEVPIYHSLVEAIGAGHLRQDVSAISFAPFTVADDLPDDAAAVFGRTQAGTCVFLDSHSKLCIVHRDLGEPALPATCRHFPRLALKDGRGTFITLSHFCPTAASMLFRDDVPVEIVASPPAFPMRDYDGLTVGTEELPPLLHPRMLMDLDGYGAWEVHMVRRCAELERRPESVLATLARDARALAGWTPGVRSLREAIAVLPRSPVEDAPADRLESSLAMFGGVMAAVPEELKPAADEDGLDAAYRAAVLPRWNEFRAPLNRFLAGKAFASWTAYQGRGVASIVRGLEAALAVVRVEAARQCRDAGRALDAELLLEAFRAADFALNHLAVGDELAQGWSEVER